MHFNLLLLLSFFFTPVTALRSPFTSYPSLRSNKFIACSANSIETTECVKRTNEITNDDVESTSKIQKEEREVLSCRIKGFYPFPEWTRVDDGYGGFFGWLFKDTHQAILVKSTVGSDRVFMDFMTEDGQAHPVWWNPDVKWHVWLGGSIRGEVRIRNSGTRGPPNSQLNRLRQIAENYNTNMNLYTSNCRVFCARMQREVERLNAENTSGDTRDNNALLLSELAADARLAYSVFTAGMLPLLYPMGVLWISYEAIKDV